MKKLILGISLLTILITACTPFLYHRLLGTPTKWQHLPVRVHLDLDPQTAYATKVAMRAWIVGTKRQLFILSDRRHLSNLRIKYDTDACHDYQGKLSYAETKYQIYEKFPHFHKSTILICPIYKGKRILINVMMHELGHVLGLIHVKDPKSIMYPKMKPTAKIKDLSKKDLENIKTLYSDWFKVKPLQEEVYLKKLD